MKWWNTSIFFVVLNFSGISKCDTNITPLIETKKPCDKFATDAQHQTNKRINATTTTTSTPEANILPSYDYQNDDYVVEDNELRQNDQPDRHLRLPYSYGSIRKQPPQYEKHKFHQHREDPNVEYTKEVNIKQGRLKGMVRRMHAQSGLRNVDQYLGKWIVKFN